MDLKSLFSKGSLFIQGPLKGPILYAMRSGSQLCQKKEPRRCWLRTESRRTATANVTSKEGHKRRRQAKGLHFSRQLPFVFGVKKFLGRAKKSNNRTSLPDL